VVAGNRSSQLRACLKRIVETGRSKTTRPYGSSRPVAERERVKMKERY
jgi:hypothetical protein